MPIVFRQKKQGYILIVGILLIAIFAMAGIYFYFQRQSMSPPNKNSGDRVLLLVEDTLVDGLANELKTYGEDINREFGFQSIVKSFPVSATVFELKSFIGEIYNTQKLNGVLLVGNLASGKFYNPDIPSKAIWYSEGLPLNDYIYQDVFNHCVYSQERDAFDYTSPGCSSYEIRPFWVSRLTPNSSSQDSLAALEDYFKRNHEYRSGKYKYGERALIYTPILIEEQPPFRQGSISRIQEGLEFISIYSGKYEFIDPSKPDSGRTYLNRIKELKGYEIVLYNGHGAPTTHQAFIGNDQYIGPEAIKDANFFFADFRSCSIGRFTVKDYMVGKYLFEGKGLVARAASVPVFGGSDPDTYLYFALTEGDPLFQALKVVEMGASNMLGDLTLRMRYKQSTIHSSQDPQILISPSSSLFQSPSYETQLTIRNNGNSPLRFRTSLFRFHAASHVLTVRGTSSSYSDEFKPEKDVFLLPPQSEGTIISKLDVDPNTISGMYPGELFLFSNDSMAPVITIPFEVQVQ